MSANMSDVSKKSAVAPNREENGDTTNGGEKSLGTTETDKRRQRSEDETCQENVRLLKNAQTTALATVTRKRNELSAMMADVNNLHLVKTGFTQWLDAVGVYERAHKKLNGVLDTQDQERNAKRYEEKKISIADFDTQVQIWIQKAESQLAEKLESVPHHPKSRIVREIETGSRESQD